MAKIADPTAQPTLAEDDFVLVYPRSEGSYWTPVFRWMTTLSTISASGKK